MIKPKDLSLIIIVVVISGAVSLILANLIFKTDKVKTKVEVVEAITSDFPLPSNTYFNTSSLNLTQTITIGDTNNNKPFSN